MIGRYVAWDWIRNNWSLLAAYYDTAISSGVSRIIATVAGDFNPPFDLDNLVEFINQHQEELGSARRASRAAVENARANVRWMETHYQTVIDWLQPRIELD